MQPPNLEAVHRHEWRNPKSGTSFALNLEEGQILLDVITAKGIKTVECHTIEEAFKLSLML